MKSTRLSLLALCAFALLTTSCYEPVPLTEGAVLGGENIDAATLNRGRKAYSIYCASCHGLNGDGRGTSAAGLNPPPRDFRIATFKFAAVKPGKLPHDEDLLRIIEGGLHGTGMVKWQIPKPTLLDIIQYIKAFSPEKKGFRHPKKKKGERMVGGDDPWAGKTDAAIARGKIVYHGMADCQGCHPAYANLAEINETRKVFERDPLTELRAEPFMSLPKESTTYTTVVEGNPVCDDKEQVCSGKQICNLGICEKPVWMTPPDFFFNEVRAGAAPADLFRVIAAGVPGTAMPTWKGSLKDDEIWAIAHYVSHLIGLKGKPEATALRKALAQ